MVGPEHISSGPDLGLADSLPFRDPKSPVESECKADVGSNIHPKETKVPPAVTVFDLEMMEELVGGAQGAVAARLGRIWVQEVASRGLGKGPEEISAIHAIWRLETKELLRMAFDFRVCDGRGHDTADQIRPW